MLRLTAAMILSGPPLGAHMNDVGPLEIAIEPKTKRDQEKMGVALAKLVADDSSFGVLIDNESGQTIIKGTSERHLDAKLDILKRTYKVDLNVGAPQVAYRETITGKSDVDYTHKKQSGGP